MCIWFNSATISDEQKGKVIAAIRAAYNAAPDEAISDCDKPQKYLSEAGFTGDRCDGWLYATLDGRRMFGAQGSMGDLDKLSQVVLMAAGMEGGYLEQFFKVDLSGSCSPEDYWSILASRVRLIWYASYVLPDDQVELLEGSLTLPGVSLDTPGMVSYARSPADKYDPRKRIKTTIGRWFKRQHGVDLPSDAGAKLTALIGGDSGWEFEITSEVYQAYQDVKVASCMAGKCYTKMYNSIEGCQLIKARRRHTEKWTARALLWDGKYVDRIYPDSAVDVFREFGKGRGWVHLEENDYASSWADGAVITKVVGSIPREGWPYVDTLRYLHHDSKGFSISNLSRGSIFELSEQDGGPELQECSECGDWEKSDDCTGDLCQYCYEIKPACAACGDRSDDLEALGDNEYCSHCASRRFVCEDCESVELRRSCVELDGREVCQGCAEEYTACLACAKHYLTEDMEKRDDNYYCSDCAPEETEKELVTVEQWEGGENVNG